MGRSPGADEAGGIYHALNRGNAKSPIFFKEQSTWAGALGDTHKPGAILASLKPFSLERFLLLRQIVVNCFNSKEITSVHLNA